MYIITWISIAYRYVEFIQSDVGVIYLFLFFTQYCAIHKVFGSRAVCKR